MRVAKDAVDDVEQPFAAFDDALHVVCLAVVKGTGDLLLEYFRQADDAGERGAQLVADHSQEFVLKLVGPLKVDDCRLQVGRARR